MIGMLYVKLLQMNGSSKVGIAGAQDYLPPEQDSSWVCATCNKRYTLASAKAWLEDGALKQQCKFCYEKEDT